MFSRNNNIFVDDLSVTKDNYLIAVLKMLIIFLVINYGTDISYDHEYVGLFIILLGVSFKHQFIIFQKIKIPSYALYYIWIFVDVWIRLLI